jgi:hypothetical protein
MQLTKEINLQNSKSIFSKHLSIHCTYIIEGVGYFNQGPIHTKIVRPLSNFSIIFFQALMLFHRPLSPYT